MELYNVILFSKSGLPVFQKEFIPNDKIKARLLTGLVTAMNRRCDNIVGAPCCYLEFANVSLAIVKNSKHSMSCLLVYSNFSKNCSEEFGKLIATELVESFCNEYGEELDKLKKMENNRQGMDEKHFKDFENKIASVVKNSITPVLEFLQSDPDINVAMLISPDQLLPHNHSVDAISFVSEFRSLTYLTKQIMSICTETDSELVIHAHDSIIIVRKIENASLVVAIKKNCERKQTFSLVQKYCEIIMAILKLQASLGETATDSFAFSVLI